LDLLLRIFSTGRRSRVALAAGSAIAIAALVATGVTSSALGATSSTTPNKGQVLDTYLTSGTFANPSSTDLPWVRWPLAPTVTNAELQKELVDMKNAGIGGAEIGQGTFPSISQLGVILTKANQLGITISLSHGPVSAPAGFTVNDDNARKNLTYGKTVVAAGATFNAALPKPTTANRITLVSVQAYKCADATCPTTGVPTLDKSSMVDLTSTVTGKDTAGVNGGSTTGSIDWTAPAGTGQYELIAMYSVGYIAQPDLLTTTGAQVLIDNMTTQFAPIKSLLQANGGDLMFDSHATDRGSPNDSWSNTMPADFEAQTGYSITDYLPLVLGTSTAPAFNFDTATSTKFRNDFYQARTDLWVNNQIKPLQNWAHGYNQDVRLQPYGQNDASTDAIQASTVLDKTETETLWFGDEVDNYLPEASAVHMTGNNWYSIEGSAELNAAYAMTLQDQATHMNKAFAGGVTKLIYHIYPYSDSSTSTWPGYSLFPNSFGQSWGPRNPDWAADADAYNTYFARNQQVLTQGAAKTDVAVYMQNYTWAQPYTQGNQQYWSDPTLERNGYTRDYLDPTTLDLPNATVTNGRLAADGPDYKAFIYDSTQLPTAAASRTTMPIDTAKKILSYAKSGLPVVIVGTPPTGVPGVDPAGDTQLQGIVTQILAQSATHVVATEAAVPALLKTLGVTPSAQPATAGPVLSVHREDANTDFYWLYNQGSVISAGEPASNLDPVSDGNAQVGTAVDTTFTLQGHGTPYLLNTWDGTTTPIADYTSTGDTVTVHVKLAAEDTEVVALSTDPSRFDSTTSPVHVVSTTADSIVSKANGDVYITAATPGVYATTLSNGNVIHTTVGAASDPVNLTGQSWNLAAEAWTPDSGASAYATTFGTAATQTDKTPVNVTLDSGLKSWPNIPALTDASGTGDYTTTVNLPSDWESTTGATLNLGAVTDSFTVKVNGKSVPFSNQVTSALEIGSYLHAGANTLEVSVATTLKNELRTLDTTIGARAKQQNGLVGPVTLTPYATAKVQLTGNAPVVTTQPVPSTIVAKGANVTLTAAATGATSTQWQSSTDGGATWSTVDGATSGSYTFATSVSGTEYRAVFTNDYGTTNSSVSVVTLKNAPVVTVNPARTTTVTVGKSVTLKAAASGVPSPTGQWQVSTNKGKTWKNVSGATADSYTFTPKSSASGNEYRDAFTNDSGTVYTTVAKLTVKKLTSTVKISVSHSGSHAKKPVVKVTVKPTSGKPLGTVTVHYGSHSKKATLKSSSKGVVKVTLPTLKKGTYTVYATYAGSPTYASDSSAKVKLTIK
jgi:alpha-L-rhamnosidase/Bacterial Ig-like domain (group 3)